MDLAEYYEEVTKTAGLKAEAEADVSEEKIAAIVAVTEQFEIDGIDFEDEDEKIAAAVAIVDGFESATETSKEAGVKEFLARNYEKAKGGIKKGYEATKEHLKKHKHKYGYGATAAGAGGAGFYAGRKSK